MLRIGGAWIPVIEAGGKHVRIDALVPDLLESRPDRGLLNLFDDWPGSEQRLLEVAARVPTATVAEQASLLSEFVAIEPGDGLLTGTPAGVGLASGTDLDVGDRIEATISGLGTMSVGVVPDSPSSGTPRVA